MIRNALLFLVLLTCSIPLMANSAGQTSWVGGPGVTGPVGPWGDSFLSSSNIDFDTTPGKLSLSAPYGSHLIEYQTSNPSSTALGDINGDGYMDFVAVTGEGVFWWKNTNGTGFSWIRYPITSTSDTRSWTLAYDFDKDGDLDVAASLYGDGLYWWENTGAGTSWIEHIIQSADTRGCCLGDFDNDGWMDIGLTVSNTADVLWWRNKLGTSHDWSANYIDGSFTGAYAIDAGQMNGSGGVDIAVGSGSNGQVAVYLNNLGSWDKEPVIASYTPVRHLKISDINGDGKYDIVSTVENALIWWENINWNYWTVHEINGSLSNAYGVGVADLNNDGHDDVLAISRGNSGLLYWYQNNGTGTNWQQVDSFLSRQSYDVSIGDINGDGVPGMITTSSANYSTIQQYRIGGYNAPGELISSIYDTGAPENINWDYLHWDAVEPGGTDFRVSIRGSSNSGSMGEWSDWLSASTPLVGLLDPTDRYIQYKLSLTTSSAWVSPILNDITFLWSVTGIEGGEGDVEPLVLIGSNPSFGSFQLDFNLPTAGTADLTIFDLSGRLVASPASGYFEAGTHSALVTSLPAGIYVCRYAAPEVTAQLQVVVIR